MIQADSLSRSYRLGSDDFWALQGASLTITRGETVAILGPSGSGKSTLLNIIGGIDRPTAGTVIVDGLDITKLSDRELTRYRREKLGFVFQFYNLIPNLTVQENVEVATHIGLRPLGLDRVLESVGMLGKRDKFPPELSGGEQQRAAIARAVAKNPAVLLCDEPTGALDYRTSREILKLLEQVNREFGTTILMVTHNTAIGGMTDRIVKMRGGEIVENIVNTAKVGAEGVEW